MKRLLLLVLSICLVVSICGCKGKEPGKPNSILYPAESTASSVAVPTTEAHIATEMSTMPETESIPMDSITSPMESVLTDCKSVLESILNGTGSFYDIDFETDVTISESCAVWSEHSGITVSTPKFTVVDMDGDGIKEIIFKVLVNGVSDYGVKVIHHENGNVYGFTFSDRQLMNIKDDGSFWCSGSEDMDGAAKIAFSGDTYTYTAIPTDQFDSKPDITWYEYPDSNYSALLN